MCTKLNTVFTRVVGDVVQDRLGHLRGRLAQFNTGPGLQEQVNTDQKSVPNVEQTFVKKKKKKKPILTRSRSWLQATAVFLQAWLWSAPHSWKQNRSEDCSHKILPVYWIKITEFFFFKHQTMTITKRMFLYFDIKCVCWSREAEKCHNTLTNHVKNPENTSRSRNRSRKRSFSLLLKLLLICLVNWLADWVIKR